MFGAGAGMMIAPPDPNKRYTLTEAALGLFDREKWELYLDFTIIADMAKVRLLWKGKSHCLFNYNLIAAAGNK